MRIESLLGKIPWPPRYSLQARVIVFVLWAAMAPPSPLRANPSEGVVVHGDVRMSGSGRTLTVNQNSRNAIIDWASFSVESGELTRFIQPGRDSAVLNRVTGGDPSEIHGSLRGNGSVFVINPNGILVGPGGRIDAHSVVLSTLDVSNGEFLSRGDLVFKGAGEAGVTNLGRVQGIDGDVILIGRTVENRGSLKAAGTVGLAAGSEVLLSASDGPSGQRLLVRASGSGVSGDGIYNDGTIEGAAVELKTHGNIYALAINNKGSIRATGATVSGGRVTLHAPGGRISNSGSIRASTINPAHSAKVIIAAAYARVDGQIRADSVGGRGGEILVNASETAEVSGRLDATGGTEAGGTVTVQGEEVLIGSSAHLNASGGSGGEIKIGGGFRGEDASVRNASRTRIENGAVLIADATGDGDAGRVVVWSDKDTHFRGQVSAEAKGTGRGGIVEVSGKEILDFDGVVSTLATDETRNGQLLLDPTDFEIVTGAAGANQMTATALASLLGGGNVIISTLDAGGDPGERGDITVNPGANVVWNNGNSLTLLAHSDIRIGANIRNSGSGGIHLIAGWDGISGLPALTGAHLTGSVLRADSFSESSFGNGGGSVYIGDGQQAQRISVGSRAGDTLVAAYDLVLRSRDADVNTAQRNAQLGIFDGSNPGQPSGAVHSGNIGVRARNDIKVLGGSNARAWAQIGHGGNVEGVAVGSSYTGDISLRAGRDVVIESALTANNGVRSFAQVGHGGAGNGGVMSGNLLVEAGREVRLNASTGNFSYAQIGHGGYGSSGVASGSIAVRAGEGVHLAGGSSTNNYAQIGHGGGSSSVTAVGDIQLESGATGVVSNAGIGAAAYVQIGHGGSATSQANLSGSITVSAIGDIAFGRTGGNVANAYSMIGHGGTGAVGEKSGAIRVDSLLGSVLFGTNETGRGRSAVQIGHGGREGSGDTSGSIIVNAPAGDIRFHGVIADGNILHREGYAQIGHGGRQNTGNHGAAGDSIYVTAGGDLEFLAGGAIAENEAQQGREAYAQLGNGGYQSNGDHASDIVVNAGGDILFDTRGSSGDRAYVQLGHGGYLSSGRFSGDISVNESTGGGSITFRAGRSAAYAQLGHGGRNDHDSTRDNSGPDGQGNTADDVRVAINPNYAPGTIRGNISVFASGDILFSGGFAAGATGFAQIGHGGYQQDAEVGEGHTGNIRVVTSGGSITLAAGTRNSQHAMIGHGGHESFGNHSGNITVEAAGGISLLADGETVTVGGGDVRSFAQIGHGGVDSDFALNRVIANIGVVNGAAGFHPLIPQTNPGTVSGDITIRGTGENAGLLLRASQGGPNLGLRGYAQVGHGGLLHDGILSGNILVETRSGATLLGGTVRDSHAQIGHGGGLGAADISGDLRLAIGGTLTLSGGGAATSNALVGHGGLTSTGGVSGGLRQGSISMEVGGVTRLVDGGSSTFLGHLATGAIGGHSRYSLLSGDLDFSSSRIGVGDLIGRAIHSGEVEIGTTSGDLIVSGLSYRGESHYGLELFSTGEIKILTSIQNSGTGTISAVAGWNGVTGRTATTSDLVSFDSILNTGDSWGLDGGHIRVGDGIRTSASALGSRSGITTLLGYSIELQGGTSTASSARVGYFGTNDEPITGLIYLQTTGGGLSLSGGVGINTFAQMGHSSAGGGSIGGDIVFNAGPNGALTLSGGSGGGSHAQLGHGSVFHVGEISGNVTVSGDLSGIRIAGGDGQNSFAQVGHGGLQGRGATSGSISLGARSVSLEGGGGSASYARVGHGGVGSGGDADGTITLRAVDGDLGLLGGSGIASFVQVGHGGHGFHGSVDGSDISVFVRGAIAASGGTGLQASVQIGHGGANAESARLGGDISIVSGEDIYLSSGRGGFAYAQFGHGGASAVADITGDLSLLAGGDLDLKGIVPGNVSYVKVGHGDDLRGEFSIHRGTGLRRGELSIIAGANFSSVRAMIGHGLGSDPADSVWISVASTDPANPQAGSLRADAETVFAAGDDLRFYLPGRGNNLIARGALLNGVAWTGTRPDPSPSRGIEEFTRHFIGVDPSSPDEHTSVLGSGPVPLTAAGYAFYYDTLVNGPLTGGAGPTPIPPAMPIPLPTDPVIPVDNDSIELGGLAEDWKKEFLRRHSGSGSSELRYEGYEQYGPNGEVLIQVDLDWLTGSANP